MNKVVNDLAIYFLGNIFAKVLGLITLTLIIHSLTVEEYGYYGILISFAGLLQSILLLGNDNTIAFYYFKYKSLKGKKKFLSTVFILNTAALVLIIIASVLVYIFYHEANEYFVLIPILAGLNVFIVLFSILIRNEFNSKYFVKIQVLQSLLILIPISILFLFKIDIYTIFVIQIFSNLFVLLLLAFRYKNYLFHGYNRIIIRQALVYGMPFIPTVMLYWANSYVDRYVILTFDDKINLGFYTFAFSIVGVILILKDTVSKAWNPYIYKIYSESHIQAKELISKYLTIVLFIFSFVYINLALYSQEIAVAIGGDKYSDSSLIVSILGLTTISMSMNQFIMQGIFLKRQTKYVAIYMFYGFLVNTIVGILLVSIFSMYGVAFATILANLFFIYLANKKSQSLFPVEYNLQQNVEIIVSIVIVISLSYLTEINNIILLLLFLLLNFKIIKEILQMLKSTQR